MPRLAVMPLRSSPANWALSLVTIASICTRLSAIFPVPQIRGLSTAGLPEGEGRLHGLSTPLRSSTTVRRIQPPSLPRLQPSSPSAQRHPSGLSLGLVISHGGSAVMLTCARIHRGIRQCCWPFLQHQESHLSVLQDTREGLRGPLIPGLGATSR